ncbi:hypothetical protein [Chryseolinea sp. H1M3-3]|uniref:hypothetical protein n=1 Tax=Chryseolinea sp. H1M3-3 TaxID=3034144 RepID=UPI0023EC5AD0|nr:hypothetical protein [Chryseolinea sp. H1M3-3]
MSRGVIVIYRPKKGMDQQVIQLVREHISILRQQNLATKKSPIVMRAKDGSIIEIFEWISAEAIANAHENKAVQELWGKFSSVCDYEIPVNVEEFHSVFSEFEVIE